MVGYDEVAGTKKQNEEDFGELRQEAAGQKINSNNVCVNEQ